MPYRRIQNRESATRTRHRKATYISQLEGQLSMLLQANQDLKVTNASLTTENAMLKQQVAYFEKLLAAAPATKAREELVLEDPANYPDASEKEAVLGSDDSDYIFAGTLGHEGSLSAGPFVMTFIFALLCLVSMFWGDATVASGALQTGGGRELKSRADGEPGSSNSVMGWLLNPYVLFVVYMLCMCVYMCRREKSWVKSKLRYLCSLLKSHSKTS
jgi:hypothetical protein